MASSSLANDLKKMINNENHSDFTIVCSGGEEFKAHKVILAARSEYFANIFQSGMVEAQVSRVDFVDINKRSVEALLRYLYMDQLPSTPANAIEMLPIADRFQLASLRDSLLEFVRGQFSTENVLQIYICALKSASVAEDLKKSAFNYILMNISEVIKSDDWFSVVQNHADIATQIIAAMAKKTTISPGLLEPYQYNRPRVEIEQPITPTTFDHPLRGGRGTLPAFPAGRRAFPAGRGTFPARHGTFFGGRGSQQ